MVLFVVRSSGVSALNIACDYKHHDSSCVQVDDFVNLHVLGPLCFMAAFELLICTGCLGALESGRGLCLSSIFCLEPLLQAGFIACGG